MRPDAHAAANDIPESLTPAGGGWHCSHFFYRFRRDALATLPPEALEQGRQELAAATNVDAETAPLRLQVSLVSGHKADWALMLLDPDPLKVEAVHQRVLASGLGPAIEAVDSYVSITEISEYVLSVEDFGQRLIREGMTAGTPEHTARVEGYARRLEGMNRQRLTPEFPAWQATCFYPMNKWRYAGQNWFTLPKSARNELMSEHARSGIAFAGKVSQLITVSVGLDDWEWGVTLWAKNPEFLKQIVYGMRFDEASAKYAEFGKFYTSYVMSMEDVLRHCHV